MHSIDDERLLFLRIARASDGATYFGNAHRHSGIAWHSACQSHVVDLVSASSLQVEFNAVTNNRVIVATHSMLIACMRDVYSACLN